MTKVVGSHTVLLQIDTLRCQRKELEHKEIKPVSLSIVEL